MCKCINLVRFYKIWYPDLILCYGKYELINQNPNKYPNGVRQQIAPKKGIAQNQPAEKGVPEIVDPRRFVQLAEFYRVAK